MSLNLNHSHIQYWSIVPAAGLGLRMGATKPKQYLTLIDQPIIAYSVNALAKHPRINQVVVALHKDDMHWSQVKLENPSTVITTRGGPSRAHSVFQGLKAIKSQANDHDWVLVHDAVRPCIHGAAIDRLITQIADHAVGGLLALQASDSVKLIDENQLVEKGLPREKIWLAQTPQMFRFKILFEAMVNALTHEIPITDEASAVEHLGKKPVIVAGDITNIKITYASDLLIAEQFLKAKEGLSACV